MEFLDRFLEGVSAGSGLTKEELVRINGVEVAYGEELMRWLGVQTAGKCSTLALFGDKTPDGRMLFGRNYDWMPSFTKLGLVLTVLQPTDSSMQFATLNYPGCFYLTTGMNSAGVFLELNAGSFASADQNPGTLHNAWSLWHVLTQAKTTDEAVRVLKSLPSRSSYVIGIADREKSVSFEWGAHSSFVLTAPALKGFLVMTNHFEQPGWTNLPIASAGGVLSSVNRLRGIQCLAEAVPSHSADVDTVKHLISVPVEEGGAYWAGTLFQVIAVPEKLEMHIRRRGYNTWATFSFRQ